MAADVIQVENLVKCFGNVPAVNGVSFRVRQGEVFGFLGPNGAGKTTTISILCTLLRPTSGVVRVNGFDVVLQPAEVRQSIGLIFQEPTLDTQLTALENLEFHALIYNVPREIAHQREAELLRMVGLWNRRDDLVRDFSGGMKRRLEVIRGLLHRPKILFLDEPTLGLDPQTRQLIWDHILDRHRQEGFTIFLTTHYLEEAENCDRIAIIDHGQIIATDSPAKLKELVGGDVIVLRTLDNRQAADVLRQRFGIHAGNDDDTLRFSVSRSDEFVPTLCQALPGQLLSVNVTHPSLNDVFIHLTGREIREEAPSTNAEDHAPIWQERRPP